MWHMIFIDLLALLTLASVLYIHGQKDVLAVPEGFL